MKIKGGRIKKLYVDFPLCGVLNNSLKLFLKYPHFYQKLPLITILFDHIFDLFILCFNNNFPYTFIPQTPL